IILKPPSRKSSLALCGSCRLSLVVPVIGSLLQPELVELIEKRNFAQLREILCNFPAPDVAEIFTDLKPGDEAVLLRILPRQLAAEVFEYLSLSDQEQLVQALGNEQVAQILNDLSPDDRTALLEELPASVTQKLLNLLSPRERKIAADLLGYPKDSIGRRMTPEYVAVQQNWTILVGVVTVDDVLDVAEQEATEDIQKMGGMEALDAPYLEIGLLSMIRKRAGWLAILFVGEMLTATAMGYFQDEIAKAVVLALFVP